MCPPIPAHAERPIRNKIFPLLFISGLFLPPFPAAGTFPSLANEKGHPFLNVLFLFISSFLSSRAASGRVLSAFMSLTTVFGMGTGVSS